MLLIVFFSLSRNREPSGAQPIQDLRRDAESPCPLCGTMLKRGERVHSVVYPGKNDRLVEIYGCPYCYPQKHEPPRRCPVCKALLSPDELVYARMFTGSSKPHIHINGCPNCMRKR